MNVTEDSIGNEAIFNELFSDKDDVIKILSKTDEECLVIAQHLKRKGYRITWEFDVMRGEVIYWLLWMYSKHGKDIAKECRKFLHP